MREGGLSSPGKREKGTNWRERYRVMEKLPKKVDRDPYRKKVWDTFTKSQGPAP